VFWILQKVSGQMRERERERERQDDGLQAQEKIENAHDARGLGEEGTRLQPIGGDGDPDDAIAVIATWGNYLEDHVIFLCEEVVEEWPERGP
jgi:hypothetical protein